MDRDEFSGSHRHSARDQTGNPSGTMALSGKIGVKAGAELEIGPGKLIQASISADAPVSAKASLAGV